MVGQAPFVGRVEDLAMVQSVLSGRGQPVLLIIGDAGVGKTRLVDEAVAGLEASGPVVLRGGCLPLAESLPLLPVVEALRAHVARDGGRGATDLLRRLPSYVAPQLTRLIPELRPVGARRIAASDRSASRVGSFPAWEDPASEESIDTDEAGEGWQRERLFLALRSYLAAAWEHQRAALVLEDLHWSDRTTFDLTRYLIAGSRQDPVAPLVITCRDDEPQTNMPFHDWVADVRSQPVQVIALAPLDPQQASEQVTALLGRRPDEAALDALYRRTGGNPFFTEQLLAADAAHTDDHPGIAMDTVPPGLTGLLRARVRQVTPDARRVLQGLAVAGTAVDEQALVEIVELAEVEVEDALVELIEARLVAAGSPDRYAPRHQLIADVVIADLLSARRKALHARYARHLAAAGAGVDPAEVAAHFAAAGDAHHELRWRIEAARAAERIYAYAEGGVHWQRVAQLWDVVPDKPPDLRLGAVYQHALGCLHQGSQTDAARELTEYGLARLDKLDKLRGDSSDCEGDAGSGSSERGEGDPEDDAARYERALLWGYAATYRRAQSMESLEAALQAAEISVRHFATLPPDHERYSALANYGILLDVFGRHDDASRTLRDALEVARATGSVDNEAGALADLAQHEQYCGDWARGVAYLDSAVELTQRSTDVEALLLIAVRRTDTYLRTGQLEEAVRAGELALDRVRPQGGEQFPEASTVYANIAIALLELGQVEDAAGLIDPLTSGAPLRYTRDVYHVRARLDLLRGDFDAAVAGIAAVRGVAPDNPSVLLDLEQDALETALWRRDPESALGPATAVFARLSDHPDSRYTGQLLATVMRAHADRAEGLRSRGVPQDPVEVDVAALEAAHASMRHDPFAEHPGVATAHADWLTWRAERARVTAGDTAEQWQEVAEEWIALRRPHRAAYAHWRTAQAQLRTGQLPAAAAALQTAAALAAAMGPQLEQIKALSGLARIRLGTLDTDPAPPAVDPDAAPFGLTERELQVLQLLGQGRTNKEIGQALFMSPKTASVHVSRILGKLGVDGRLQAATLAQSAGLITTANSPKPP